MTKSQLIAQINQSYRAGASNSNTSYASINKSKEVWWLNIPVSKFESDVHVLLSTPQYALWVHLPKDFIKQLAASFKIREDKNAVDLEISSDKKYKYLIDVKSGGSGFDFTTFIKEKIVY